MLQSNSIKIEKKSKQWQSEVCNAIPPKGLLLKITNHPPCNWIVAELGITQRISSSSRMDSTGIADNNNVSTFRILLKPLLSIWGTTTCSVNYYYYYYCTACNSQKCISWVAVARKAHKFINGNKFDPSRTIVTLIWPALGAHMCIVHCVYLFDAFNRCTYSLRVCISFNKIANALQNNFDTYSTITQSQYAFVYFYPVYCDLKVPIFGF